MCMNEICAIIDFNGTVQGRPEYIVLATPLRKIPEKARNYSKNEE